MTDNQAAQKNAREFFF